METITKETLAEARRIIAEAEEAENLPEGSHVVSRTGCMILSSSKGMRRDTGWRELTASELEILKGIPELAEALK